MRYILDNEGYVLNVFFGCYGDQCQQYEGEVPEGYETLALWAENANIRAYKMVEGNLILDTVRNAELERIYEKEAEENSNATKKYVNEKFGEINTIYDDELSTTVEGFSLFKIIDAKDADIVEIKVTPREPITENFKIKITNKNMLMNKGLNQEINGLSFEINEDKSITINGTATADTEFVVNGSSTNTDTLFFLNKNKTYVQHGFGYGVKLNLYSYDGTDRSLISSMENGTINLSSTAYITYVTLNITSGAEFKDVTIYPMIEYRTQTDYVESKENPLLNIDLEGYTFENDDVIQIDRTSYMFTKNIYLYPGDDLFPSDDLFPIDYDETIWGNAETQRTFEDETLVQCDKAVILKIRYFSKDYLNEKISQIQVEQDEIKIEVGEKVGNDEIISKINLTRENITIDANRINFNGAVSANGNFLIDTDGNMQCNNADIRGKIHIGGDSSNPEFIAEGDYYRTYIYPLGLLNEYDMYNSYVAIEKGSIGLGTYTETSMTETAQITHEEIRIPKVTQTSKESVKKNIVKYSEKALNIVKNSEIYEYNFKSEDDSNKKHIGFVIGDESGVYKTPEQVISNDREGIDTYSMCSILWKAVQEQQKTIEELTKEIELLKGEK